VRGGILAAAKRIILELWIWINLKSKIANKTTDALQTVWETNLDLSVFSLGTMRYLASEDNARQTIQQAVLLGINHLETARGYGKSEQYLGVL